MSTIAVNAITDASGGSAASINGYTPSASNMTGRNRIINGAMMIDQRNAGASVTPINGQYLVDRWAYNASQASKFTAQQNAGTVTPPAGFKNYLGLTVASAFTVGAGDNFTISQRIEGFNCADLGWGAAGASTVTLSFWVRSSLTGTFGGSIINGGFNRTYPFTYVINAANTWEQKTVTIAGDTTGTWATDNSWGIAAYFSLGAGSTLSGTAGAWSSTAYVSATGATSVVGTSGATFYLTGVQLEVGSSASEFEHRLYGTELQLAQRYYWEANWETFGSNTWATGANGAAHNLFTFRNPVEMRADPTLGIADQFSVYSGSSGAVRTSIATSEPGRLSSRILFSLYGTVGDACWLDAANSSSKLTFSSEL